MTKLYEDYADLYDAAFDWDVSEEVDWLLARLGPGCHSVLEPGCGSGRILAAIAQRGLEAVGLDRSQPMIEIAHRRFRDTSVEATAVLADITRFQLNRLFDGAVCPINTLTHLSPEELSRHLDVMAQHLKVGARYLVQLDLYDSEADAAEVPPERWEMTRGDMALRVSWRTEPVDPATQHVRQRSRIEILSGGRAGEVVEETHVMTAWTPTTWAGVVTASPFAPTAVFDGYQDDRPLVDAGRPGQLLWHELTRQSQVSV
ncbi:MAG TPA: class I SAM-dependent methyltransferase [Actinomycetota bacterium]|nr:class I SAM-dependent methyltransferase [Actinomycetota bacterium]